MSNIWSKTSVSTTSCRRGWWRELWYLTCGDVDRDLVGGIRILWTWTPALGDGSLLWSLTHKPFCPPCSSVRREERGFCGLSMCFAGLFLVEKSFLSAANSNETFTNKEQAEVQNEYVGNELLGWIKSPRFGYYEWFITFRGPTACLAVFPSGFWTGRAAEMLSDSLCIMELRGNIADPMRMG